MSRPGAVVRDTVTGKVLRDPTTGRIKRFNAAGECPECCVGVDEDPCFHCNDCCFSRSSVVMVDVPDLPTDTESSLFNALATIANATDRYLSTTYYLPPDLGGGWEPYTWGSRSTTTHPDGIYYWRVYILVSCTDYTITILAVKFLTADNTVVDSFALAESDGTLTDASCCGWSWESFTADRVGILITPITDLGPSSVDVGYNLCCVNVEHDEGTCAHVDSTVPCDETTGLNACPCECPPDRPSAVRLKFHYRVTTYTDDQYSQDPIVVFDEDIEYDLPRYQHSNNPCAYGVSLTYSEMTPLTFVNCEDHVYDTGLADAGLYKNGCKWYVVISMACIPAQLGLGTISVERPQYQPYGEYGEYSYTHAITNYYYLCNRIYQRTEFTNIRIESTAP